MYPGSPQQGPTNADYILDLTRKVEQLNYQTQVLEYLLKGVSLLAADTRGTVRLSKPLLNKIPKMMKLHFDENDAGAIIIKIEMEDGVKLPAQQKADRAAKARAKGKGKK